MKEWKPTRRQFLTACALGTAPLLLGKYYEWGETLPPEYPLNNPPRPAAKPLTPLFLMAAPHENQYPIRGPDNADISSHFQSVHLFFNAFEMDDPVSREKVKKIGEAGQMPFISLTPPWNPADRVFRFKRDIPSYLAALTPFLQFLHTLPFDHAVSVFFEANLQNSLIYDSAFNTPEDFVWGFQQTSEHIQTVSPKTNIVWRLNAGYPIAPYFPDVEYFDIAGLDVYNKYRSFPHPAYFHKNESFYNAVGSDVRTIQELTDKKIIIVETNSARGGNFRTEWFRRAIELASSWKNIIGLGGFFWNKGDPVFDLDPNETNWDVTNDSTTWKNFSSMLDTYPNLRQNYQITDDRR